MQLHVTNSFQTQNGVTLTNLKLPANGCTYHIYHVICNIIINIIIYTLYISYKLHTVMSIFSSSEYIPKILLMQDDFNNDINQIKLHG